MSYMFHESFPNAHESLVKGDSLSDPYLDLLYQEYSEIIKRLEVLGPEYRLTVNELRRLRDRVESYRWARENRDKD